MRYLGIDYGSKRVGVALSDPENIYAFPKAVLPNNESLLDSIEKICLENNVTDIVIGESKDFSGKENLIMKDISSFKNLLEQKTNLPVYLEPEFLTSAQAMQLQGNTKMLDASAAALILKSFLDRMNK